MAKKDKKTANSKKGKIPKEIAGIKIPKELRKLGEALIATASSPAGRSMLISGATALMATMASRARSARQPTGSTAAPDGVSPVPPAPARAAETNDNGSATYDPEAAGAQVARRIIEVIGIAANAAKGSPGSGKTGG